MMANETTRDEHELRCLLADSVRICVTEGLVENFGHVSARNPESGRIFILRHLHERLNQVKAEDFVEVDRYGRNIAATIEPPNEVFLHTEIYGIRKDVNAVVYTHPLYSTIFGLVGKTIMPLLANCTFLQSAIPIFEEPRSVSTTEIAAKLVAKLGSSYALLMRGSGLVTVARSVQEATLLSILIEKSARVQYMASAIGKPREIVAADVPGRFGKMPTHFFESSWEHYVSKSRVSPAQE